MKLKTIAQLSLMTCSLAAAVQASAFTTKATSTTLTPTLSPTLSLSTTSVATTTGDTSNAEADAQRRAVLEKPELLSTDELKELVAKALPAYDEGILKPYRGSDPVGKLDFGQLAEVMGDRFTLDVPPEVNQADDGIRALRVDAEKASVRYVNRDRSWQFERDAKSRAIDAKEAQNLAIKSLAGLGFSTSEMAKPFVTKQMAAGAQAGAEKPTDVMEMYRYIVVPRALNGFKVSQSGVKLAINNYGDIQRLSADWPQLNLPEGLQLRDREAVIEHALSEIADQHPSPAIILQSEVQYALSTDGEELAPFMVLNVQDYPSPYQLAIPLAELATGDEK